jgi:hypothetical protein
MHYVILLLLVGCPKKSVVRNASSFYAETLAALARQEEAADALRHAAVAAKVRGDRDACEQYAKPALLIDASARAQAHRALWLAGLPYPVDGITPPRGTEQPDPGPSTEPAPTSTLCD